MSGNKEQMSWVGYKDKNIHHLPFHIHGKFPKDGYKNFLNKSLKNLKKKINLKSDICGVMIETFQGWGALFIRRVIFKH